MPELPEVETVRRSLQSICGQKLVAIEIKDARLRYPVPRHFGHKAIGCKLESQQRIGKYLLWKFSGETIVFHLGMTGRMLLNQPEASRYLKVRFLFQKDTVDFIDVRRFGFVLGGVAAQKALPAGIDALQASGKYLESGKIARSRTPIKNLLLDQSILAGLGNIYVSEILFEAGVNPQRSGMTLSAEEFGRIAQMCREVLARAIRAKGSSISDFVFALPGEKTFTTGNYQKEFLVYGRAGEACKKCSGQIKRIVQSGRSTFFCPQCQI